MESTETRARTTPRVGRALDRLLDPLDLDPLEPPTANGRVWTTSSASADGDTATDSGRPTDNGVLTGIGVQIGDGAQIASGGPLDFARWKNGLAGSHSNHRVTGLGDVLVRTRFRLVYSEQVDYRVVRAVFNHVVAVALTLGITWLVLTTIR